MHVHPLPFPPMRLPLLSACSLATLLAAGLHAQSAPPQCPAGEADPQGITINFSVDAHPTRVASTVDSLLQADGYEVSRSPRALGRWQIAPRSTYLDAVKDEAWTRDPHPGLRLVVATEQKGDSVGVRVGAWVVCKPADASTESVLEVLSAGRVATGLTGTLDTLRAAGVDVRAEVPRPGLELAIPGSVGEFRLVDQEQYEDRRLGTGLRYSREDGLYLDAYVYPGIHPDSTCPAACGQAIVDEEVEAFAANLPDLIQRGYYTRMDVTSNEPVARPADATWLGGRHLRMEVVRAQGSQGPQESDFILYAFPGYMVKVRATYPPSTKDAGAIREFTAAFLAALVRS